MSPLLFDLGASKANRGIKSANLFCCAKYMLAKEQRTLSSMRHWGRDVLSASAGLVHTLEGWAKARQSGLPSGHRCQRLDRGDRCTRCWLSVKLIHLVLGWGGGSEPPTHCSSTWSSVGLVASKDRVVSRSSTTRFQKEIAPEVLSLGV